MQRHMKSVPVDFRLTFWANRLTFYFLSVGQFSVCYEKAVRSFLVNRAFFFFRSFYPKGKGRFFTYAKRLRSTDYDRSFVTDFFRVNRMKNFGKRKIKKKNL
jgi:hypothetical protein